MDRRQQLRAELDPLMRKVPATYSNWSHNKSVKFKEFIARAKKLIAKSSTTESQLQSLVSEYKGFSDAS